MNNNFNMKPGVGLGIYDNRSCRNTVVDTSHRKPVANDQSCAIAGEPLAISSVPMQSWRMVYSPDKALKAGTMFAELNLPFTGGGCK